MLIAFIVCIPTYIGIFDHLSRVNKKCPLASNHSILKTKIEIFINNKRGRYKKKLKTTPENKANLIVMLYNILKQIVLILIKF